MRLFRKKADSPAHQEYLDGLISSIRQARKEEREASAEGLHSFVEEDQLPVPPSMADPKAPPSANAQGTEPQDAPLEGASAEEIASLEAYLSKLEEADAARQADDEENSSAV